MKLMHVDSRRRQFNSALQGGRLYVIVASQGLKDPPVNTADTLLQIYYGRYITADILRPIYYGGYTTAEVLQ